MDNEQKKSDAEHPGITALRSIHHALKPGSDLNKKLSEYMKPLYQAAEKLQPYVDQINEFSKRMQPSMIAFHNLALKYQPQIEAFVESLKRFEEFNAGLIERHEKELLGLPPFFNELNVTEIYKLFEDRSKSALSVYREVFLKKENTDAMLASWATNKFYEDRMPIFRDAVEAHLAEKHTLSIPVFLSQIEGILCQVFEVPDHGKVKGKLSAVKFKPEKEDRPFAGPELISTIITDHVFLSSRNNGKTAYPNRHLVLHGTNPFYYKDENASLRCILLLDLLRSEKFLALNSKASGD